MQNKQWTTSDNLPTLPTRVYNLVNSVQPSSAVTTHPFSKTTPQRNNHAVELRQQSDVLSPLLWNETLAFAADG